MKKEPLTLEDIKVAANIFRKIAQNAPTITDNEEKAFNGMAEKMEKFVKSVKTAASILLLSTMISPAFADNIPVQNRNIKMGMLVHLKCYYEELVVFDEDTVLYGAYYYLPDGSTVEFINGAGGTNSEFNCIKITHWDRKLPVPDASNK